MTAAGSTLEEPSPPGARRLVGRATTESLPFELRPEPRGDGVLLVAHDEVPNRSFVRRIDATGATGPVRLLERRPVSSFGGAAPSLATSDGTTLCVEPFGSSAETGPAPPNRCVRAAPLAIVPFAGGLALIEALPERDVEDDEPAASDAPAGHSAAGVARAARSGPGEPERTRIGLRLMPTDGPIADEPGETGLEVRWPMPGMELVDAVPTADGIALAWYEHLRFVGRGRQRAEAELRAGLLDRTGTFVRSSRVRLFGGTREYGSIEGHLAPRLVTGDGRPAFVGRTLDSTSRTKRFGYEARLLSPSRPLDAAPALCRIDPAALARPGPPTPSQLAVLDAIANRRPELSPGQPRSDIEQVAWTAQRGYFVSDGTLLSVERASSQLRPLDWPFSARRVRVLGAAISPTGEGIALTTEHFVLLHADATLEEREARPTTARSGAASARLAAEGEAFARVSPARVGACWWRLAPGSQAGTSGWRLVGLGECGSPSTPEGSPPAVPVPKPLPMQADGPQLPLAPSLAALVGGRTTGMLLRARFDEAGRGWLDVDEVAPNGGLTRLASHRAPATTGLVAVERKGGGAIAVARSAEDPTGIVGFAIDAQGALLGSAPVALEQTPPSRRLELWPLPAGGALVAHQAGNRVGWLDESGRARAVGNWPREHARASCVDGRPGRSWVPTPRPGKLMKVAELGRDGTCVVGQPQWAHDGSLRWIGARSRLMDSVAEIGLLRFDAPSVAPGAAGLTAASSQPPAPSAQPPHGALLGPTLGPPLGPPLAPPPCPPDMVLAAHHFCIDRYEARLADLDSGNALSPDWPATPGLTQAVVAAWTTGRWRTGDLHARAYPLPPLLRAMDAAPAIVARNEPGVLPSGYVTGLTAAVACRAAGKRLCTADEFRTACRGEEDRKFPYGESYEQGACNIFRAIHPAGVLHGNAAVGHLDPRLNRVLDGSDPLRRPTGGSPRCRSRWGEDYVYDLVGNLDEWLDEPKGAFAGGFYARATRSGCDATITAHPRRYLDYSTGVRCCRDLSRPATAATTGPSPRP